MTKETKNAKRKDSRETYKISSWVKTGIFL